MATAKYQQHKTTIKQCRCNTTSFVFFLRGGVIFKYFLNEKRRCCFVASSSVYSMCVCEPALAQLAVAACKSHRWPYEPVEEQEEQIATGGCALGERTSENLVHIW